jgi:putative ABC transport system substrate-binding protein
MRRRDFIAGILVSSAAPAWAQQAKKVYRIATVSAAVPVEDMRDNGAGHYSAFLGELRRLGYVEGENLVIERFSANGHFERFPEIVSDVIRRRPDVVLAVTGDLLREFKAQTLTIPIVAYTADPVGTGMIATLARPGGNITGISEYTGIEIWGKSLSFLKQAVPRLSRVGLLATDTRLGRRGEAMLTEAAGKLDASVVAPAIQSPFDHDAYRGAFETMVREGVEATFVGDDSRNFWNQRLIIELAQQHRLPAIYFYEAYVRNGGLMAYCANTPDMYRHAANQVDQILKGTKPGDIPFYEARKFDLMINLNAAKAIGLDLPPLLIAQADEVIE